MQDRKALVVGIDEYASTPLYGCVADANAVAEVLGKNGDGSPNFSIHLERNVECPFELKRMIEDCFSGIPRLRCYILLDMVEDATSLKMVSSYLARAIKGDNFPSTRFWR